MQYSPGTSQAEEVIQRYRALLEVSRAIASNHNQSDLFSELAHHLRQVVRFDYLSVILHEPAHNVMRLYLLEGARHKGIEPGAEFRIDHSYAGWVWEHQKPYIIANVDEESRFPESLAVLRQHQVKSYYVLPVSTAQRRLGVMSFGNVIESSYSDADLEFMQQAANHLAVSLDNALNYGIAQAQRQQLVRERDRLRLLLDVTNALVSSLDLQELFASITQCVRRVIPHEFTSLVVHDPPSNELQLQAVDFPNLPKSLQERMAIGMAEDPSGKVFRSGKPTIFGRSELERFSSPMTQVLLSNDIRSLCCLPLVTRNVTMGTLNLGSLGDHRFHPEDVDLLTRVANQIAIALENALAYQQIAELKDQISKEKRYLEDEIRTEYHFGEIVGSSPPLKKVLQLVETVAPTDSTVLIRGETGTGKELIARAIHRLSARKERTFVKLNCAAIPTGLLESELFGHEKGAFTGAIAQRVGRFELAHQGTLFLDEVGDIPLELQPKLLRVLQEMEFERLGSTRTLHVNVRLVAATNRDLAQMVRNGQFRSDLFYRLNIFPIELPALRERVEDIPQLVRYFVQKYAVRLNKTVRDIPAEAVEAMCRYEWPGNIREIENFIERAVILSRGSELELPMTELTLREHIAPSLAMPTERRAVERRKPLQEDAPRRSELVTLEEAEREHILQVLRTTRGQIGGPSGAAARLGMKRTTLNSRMKRLGISRADL